MDLSAQLKRIDAELARKVEEDQIERLLFALGNPRPYEMRQLKLQRERLEAHLREKLRSAPVVSLDVVRRLKSVPA